VHRLSQHFKNPAVHIHSRGHIIVQFPDELKLFRSFLESQRGVSSNEAASTMTDPSNTTTASTPASTPINTNQVASAAKTPSAPKAKSIPKVNIKGAGAAGFSIAGSSKL
jgi:hypothetical protein